MSRVNVKPELFRRARERARMDAAALVERFPQYEQRESGAERPTFKQLEKLARKTMTPFGPPPPFCRKARTAEGKVKSARRKVVRAGLKVG